MTLIQSQVRDRQLLSRCLETIPRVHASGRIEQIRTDRAGLEWRHEDAMGRQRSGLPSLALRSFSEDRHMANSVRP